MQNYENKLATSFKFPSLISDKLRGSSEIILFLHGAINNVAIIIASLLEAVVFKHLEAVYVEYADHGGLEVRLVLHE